MIDTLAPGWRRHAGFLLPALALVATLVIGACDRRSAKTERGEAPPPTATARVGLCDGGGGRVADGATAPFFVRRIGNYCVDPNAETRAYGRDAPEPMDAGCGQFDGECPVYKRHGLDRLVMLRYADGGGSTSSVEVKLSRFATRAGAYGFFTQRVVGDWDPLEVTVKPLDAGARAAIGSGNAYVWRGRYVAELDYRSLVESPEQQRLSARKVLTPIAKALGEKLPGEKALPPAAAALPTTDRISQGVAYTVGDLLGVSGVGPGALGYYQKGDRRWRLAVAHQADSAAAEDVRKTLKAQPGAKKLKGVPVESFAVTLKGPDGAPTEWFVTQRGRWVLAIGDEPRTSDAGAPASAASRLPTGEKIGRLRDLHAALKP